VKKGTNPNHPWERGFGMITIAVCVGSSCHLKGSYEVIARFQALIRQWQLQDEIELRGVFCMGHCTNDVAIQINEGPILSATCANIDEIFNRQVLPQVGVK
jgi:NADH:ubiquinone oxidoreductase subunit E